MKSASCFAALTIAVSLPAASQNIQKIGVPAFFGFSTQANLNDWSSIQSAGGAVKLVVADYNALSGHQSDAETQFWALRNETPAVLVLGYVNTSDTQRDKDVVLNGGDGQPSVSDWYNSYSGYIDGIFLDVGPTDNDDSASTRSYYQYLYSHVTFRSGSCSNHACVMLNASQLASDWVLTDAAGPAGDLFTLWERPESDSGSGQYYTSNFCPSPSQSQGCATYQHSFSTGQANAWYFQSSTAAVAEHIIYGATWSTDVSAIVNASLSYGRPHLYIYDGSSQGYDHLSTLFNETVMALECANGTCNGCCDSNNFCRPGNTNAWCGSAGDACDTCGPSDGTTCRLCFGSYSCVPGTRCP